MLDTYCDLIAFADESGDHGLVSIDPNFPVFSLNFCVFEKAHYMQVIEPAMRAFKFRWFGHDAIILHEKEVRKHLPPFDFMTNKDHRESFMGETEALICGFDFRWYSITIDKAKHKQKYADPWPLYELAMSMAMERLWLHLKPCGQEGRLVHVMFEARGRHEDRALELEFRRVVSNQSHWGWRKPDYLRYRFEPVFVPKAANLAGHQIADLIARPLALRAIKPDQANRVVDCIWPKMGYHKLFP